MIKLSHHTTHSYHLCNSKQTHIPTCNSRHTTTTQNQGHITLLQMFQQCPQKVGTRIIKLSHHTTQSYQLCNCKQTHIPTLNPHLQPTPHHHHPKRRQNVWSEVSTYSHKTSVMGFFPSLFVCLQPILEDFWYDSIPRPKTGNDFWQDSLPKVECGQLSVGLLRTAQFGSHRWRIVKMTVGVSSAKYHSLHGV